MPMSFAENVNWERRYSNMLANMEIPVGSTSERAPWSSPEMSRPPGTNSSLLSVGDVPLDSKARWASVLSSRVISSCANSCAASDMESARFVDASGTSFATWGRIVKTRSRDRTDNSTPLVSGLGQGMRAETDAMPPS